VRLAVHGQRGHTQKKLNFFVELADEWLLNFLIITAGRSTIYGWR
jgi:hypothetical protein